MGNTTASLTHEQLFGGGNKWQRAIRGPGQHPDGRGTGEAETAVRVQAIARNQLRNEQGFQDCLLLGKAVLHHG